MLSKRGAALLLSAVLLLAYFGAHADARELAKGPNKYRVKIASLKKNRMSYLTAHSHKDSEPAAEEEQEAALDAKVGAAGLIVNTRCNKIISCASPLPMQHLFYSCSPPRKTLSSHGTDRSSMLAAAAAAACCHLPLPAAAAAGVPCLTGDVTR
jgi:hypothetical protein